jgi:hypothetical protein
LYFFFLSRRAGLHSKNALFLPNFGNI